MGLFLFSPIVFSLESDLIEQQLIRADSLKSSNNEMFSTILTSIEPKFEEISHKQKYFFLYLKAYESAYKGLVGKAISQYKHVEESSKDTELRYRASVSLVNLYSLKKNWKNGFKYLGNISREYKAISKRDIRHQGLIAIAFFYNELEQHEMAKIYSNRLLEENVTGRNLCLSMSMKLKANLLTSQFVSLEEDIFDAITICSEIKELVVVNVLRTYLASYYLAIDKPEKLILLLEKHIQEIVATQYPFLIIKTRSLMAQAYLIVGNFLKAKTQALIVIENKNSSSYTKVMVRSLQVLSIVAKKNQNYTSAFAYQDKYIQSKESLFEQTKAKQLAVESAKHRAVERDNEISLLNQQNQILQLEQNLAKEEAEANRWIISLLILSVSLMVLWLYYIRRSQQKLKYLAEYDGLTRICNRTHFTESALTILKSLSKSNSMVSLIMFDLDHFKKVNDSFGHLTGDKVLQLAAHVCSGCVRKADIFGRIGGEEFAIILPGCEIEQALKIAEDCRKKLNKIDIKESGCDINVSASFGVTETKSSGYELKDLLAHADDAMYQAKRSGRNQVIFWKGATA